MYVDKCTDLKGIFLPPSLSIKCVNRQSDSQLKRERSAFQGRIPSKYEAANDLNRMKMHRISLQTFFLYGGEAAGLVGSFGWRGRGGEDESPEVPERSQTRGQGTWTGESQVRRTLDSVRPQLRAKLGHLFNNNNNLFNIIIIIIIVMYLDVVYPVLSYPHRLFS